MRVLARISVGEDEAQVARTDELAVMADGGSEGCGWTVVEEGGCEERAVWRKRLSGRFVFRGVGSEGGRVSRERRWEDGGEIGEAGADVLEGSGGRGGAVGGEGGPIVARGQMLEESIPGLRRGRRNIWAEKRKSESTKGALLVSGVGGADVAWRGTGAKIEDGSVQHTGFLGSGEESTQRGSLGVCRKNTVK